VWAIGKPMVIMVPYFKLVPYNQCVPMVIITRERLGTTDNDKLIKLMKLFGMAIEKNNGCSNW
jgi:hypothetical protein